MSSERTKMSQNTKAVIFIALSIFAISFSIGYYVGKGLSPDYSHPQAARIYLASYLKWKAIDSDQIELTLTAGDRIYRFKTGDEKPVFGYLSPEEIKNNRLPKRNPFKEHEKISAYVFPSIGSSGLIATVLKLNPTRYSTKTPSIIAYVVAIATGGFLGYLAGYSDAADFDDPTFRNVLENDVALWSSFEQNMRRLNNLAQVLNKGQYNLEELSQEYGRFELIRLINRCEKEKLLYVGVFDRAQSEAKKLGWME